ncbi:MAG: purine-binding chemotaxis protein CheW [Clostridia bacterium]|nr:purine-binding chemotaxis protein CheW [Clostridia bacterium]
MKKEILNLQEEKNLEEDKYLTFAIGKEVFALDIQYIDDIIGVQDITKVPEQPYYLMGVINLRGIIIPVIDIRLRFNKSFRAYDDRTCIIVVKIDDAQIGIVVDTVLEVINISEDEIANPPGHEADQAKQYMKGIGKYNNTVVIIIDCDALIRED